ncbi:UNVERIFIED_CONTAM: hypothetical protein NCL1_46439 [Trichonephila clavipes]
MGDQVSQLHSRSGTTVQPRRCVRHDTPHRNNLNKPSALGVKLTGNKRSRNLANYKHVLTDIDLHHALHVDILLVQQRPLQAHSPYFVTTGCVEGYR